ncbi:Arf-GAP with Rho-GAP domain, ANK repeat and PH domain-containing protein 1 [Sarotherodon galilaeus]
MKRGKVIRTEGIELPEGNIADVEDSYKYLGIPQVPYWDNKLARGGDIKTRKLLTMHGGLHSKSSTLRLYAKWKKGGRGLVSVSTTVQGETMNIHEYIRKMAPTDRVLSEYLRQQKLEEEEELNICAEYGLEVPRSKWEMPPRIQTDKTAVANQPDIVVVDKQKKTAVVIDVAIPNDSNIRKKEHEKLEKMLRMKVTVVTVVIGALSAVTPKLSEWLQQIPGTVSEISVQKLY